MQALVCMLMDMTAEQGKEGGDLLFDQRNLGPNSSRARGCDKAGSPRTNYHNVIGVSWSNVGKAGKEKDECHSVMLASLGTSN